MYQSSVLQQYSLFKYIQWNGLETQRCTLISATFFFYFKQFNSILWRIVEFKELVSTGDGDYRMVYAINGQIPGPEIVVTEGDVVSM